MPAFPLRRIARAAALLLVALVAYFLLWPVPVEPVPWEAPTSAGYAGAYSANSRLSALQTIDIGSDSGPEHIAVGPDGKLYAAVASGNILRLEPDGSSREVYANTGGRVLGFAFDSQGNIVAADAFKGLLKITPDRQVQVLTERVSPNDPILYADAVIVAANGLIYFTDATTRFSPSDWGGALGASLLDLMEQSATGRVLVYDPTSDHTRVVAHGLAFANGIATSEDGQALFVVETGRYRIWKIDSAAENLDVRQPSSQARVLLENLPGYPDNLTRGLDGKLWAGLAKPRSTVADRLSDKPFLMKVVARLPRFLIPVPKSYGHVFAFTEDGRVVADLQDPSGSYPDTTGVTETRDRLYIQSLHARGIGWLPASAVREKLRP